MTAADAPTILAFDCCLRAISVTILSGDNATTRQEDATTGGQAERLMPLIEATRNAAAIPWSRIDRIAVTLGPGGFTSVRVGIAAARGFALACSIPAVGVSTLEVLAETARTLAAPARPKRLLALIPAGKGGVYTQAFDLQAIPLTSAHVTEEADLMTIAKAGDFLIGPGTPLVLAAYGASSPAISGTAPDLIPSSECLARRARHLTQPSELRPIYLRAADAKPQTGKGLARA